MLRLICFTALVIASFGCNSSALKEQNKEDGQKQSLKDQASVKETKSKAENSRSGLRATPVQMEVTPVDWPMTFEQFDFLMSGGLEEAGRRSVDQNELNRAGFKSRKDLVQFAWKMLDRDLTPIKRDQGYAPGHIDRVLYMMIGLHGDLKDAELLFDRLKSLKQKTSIKESADEHVANKILAQSMGLLLMRDHFMPQENRALISDIEDYLLSCTKYGTPSCWPREGQISGDDDMRRFAILALAMSCSEKGKSRIQEYADDPVYDFSHIIAEVAFELRDRILGFEEEIKLNLDPVLPREN